MFRAEVFEYRGVVFRRTAKGYWFFDDLPMDGNAWERYGTDEEVELISRTDLDQDLAGSICRRMVDRMLAGSLVYKGDLRYRFV
jgi:hypothetical protein